MIARLLQSPVVRFLLVGGANTLAYAVLSLALMYMLPLRNETSSTIAYLVCLIPAFFAHKSVVFRSSGDKKAEFFRFVLTHAFNMGLAYAIVYLVCTSAGWPREAGVAASSIGIAVSSFILMKLWVFAHPKRTRG